MPEQRPPFRVSRSRVQYALVMVLVVGLGLFWRSNRLPLPPFIAKYGGDALWALMVFIGCGFVGARSPALRIGLVALGITWTVEFLQLYHSPWIDGIRANRLGHLVIGSTFNAPDLVAYAVGILIGMLGESAFRRGYLRGG